MTLLFLLLVFFVASQSQALRCIKEMGLFPPRVRERRRRASAQPVRTLRPVALLAKGTAVTFKIGGGVKPRVLMAFTRQLAESYDEEVDNAATAMTSLIEPIMIVLLAILVGSIVIALFLPLVSFDPL